MNQPPSADEVRSALLAALQQLYRQDRHLIHVDANERSITHRLAVYLEQQPVLQGWHIDCEYNRNQDDIKRLPKRSADVKQVRTDDLNAQTVYPDIIVHRRGTTDNLLVIEAKKDNGASSDDDTKKLEEFQQQENLRYQHGYAVRFGRSEIKLTPVVDGATGKEETIAMPEGWPDCTESTQSAT